MKLKSSNAAKKLLVIKMLVEGQIPTDKSEGITVKLPKKRNLAR